jgi:hypothetical protein
MASRTPEGKHTKRFIIEFQLFGEWVRSGNTGIAGFFETRVEGEFGSNVSER